MTESSRDFVSCVFCFVNRGTIEEAHHLDGLPLKLCLEATPIFMSIFLNFFGYLLGLIPIILLLFAFNKGSSNF